MDNDLQKRAIIERVELIARLTSEGVCEERDREIALCLIAEIAGAKCNKNKLLSAFFAPFHGKNE